MAFSSATKLRSLYRSFLRELPPRQTSPAVQMQIRKMLASESGISFECAGQFLQYVKAQRTYTMLLERYNPGMDMDAEERVRLSARRVGMEMPVDHSPAGKGSEQKGQ